jgi:Domain of unknown function (DUF834).
VVGGENEGADGLLLAPVHLTVVAATDGDDGGGGAARLEIAGDG